MLRTTYVLHAAGLIETAHYREDARKRGTDIHLATVLMDQERLNWSTVDDRYRGYLEAYARALTALRPAWSAIEQAVSDERRGVSGILDRLGVTVHGLRLVDIKTGGASSWHALQTASYQQLAQDVLGYPRAGRACLYLRKDGKFRYVEHDDPYDRHYFNAALTVAQWKERYASKSDISQADDDEHDRWAFARLRRIGVGGSGAGESAGPGASGDLSP